MKKQRWNKGKASASSGPTDEAIFSPPPRTDSGKGGTARGMNAEHHHDGDTSNMMSMLELMGRAKIKSQMPLNYPKSGPDAVLTAGQIVAALPKSELTEYDVVDIAFNFTDDKYSGMYNGKLRHTHDHDKLILRTFGMKLKFDSPIVRKLSELPRTPSGTSTPKGRKGRGKESFGSGGKGKGHLSVQPSSIPTSDVEPNSNGMNPSRSSISTSGPFLGRISKCHAVGGGLEWIRKMVWLLERFDPDSEHIFMSVGVHPTMAKEFLCSTEKFNPETGMIDPVALKVSPKVERTGYGYATADVHIQNRNPGYATKHLEELRILVRNNSKRVKCIGEIGLDYERVKFCPIDIQREYFRMQLALVDEFDLPIYAHIRGEGCCDEFFDILEEELARDGRATCLNSKNCMTDKPPVLGVVHSFTGSVEDSHTIIAHGWYVSVNGCSLKTAENCNVVAQIPLHRLILETDSPYCAIPQNSPVYPYLKCDSLADRHCFVRRMDQHLGDQNAVSSSSQGKGKGQNPTVYAAGSGQAPTVYANTTGQVDVHDELHRLNQPPPAASTSSSSNHQNATINSSGKAQTMFSVGKSGKLLQVQFSQGYKSDNGELPAEFRTEVPLGPPKEKGGRGEKGEGKKGDGKKGKKNPDKDPPSFLIKRRNEPINIFQVAEAVAVLQGRTITEVLQAARENTRELMGI